MNGWNEGLYQFWKKNGGTFLGTEGGYGTSSVLLLERPCGTLAIHGYPVPGAARDSLSVYTCVTTSLSLEGRFWMALRLRKGLEKLLDRQEDWGTPELRKHLRMESSREEAARRVLSLAAVQKALLDCPGADVVLSPVGDGKNGALAHTLQVRTGLIGPDSPWTQAASEQITPLERVERMADLAQALCDGVQAQNK